MAPQPFESTVMVIDQLAQSIWQTRIGQFVTGQDQLVGLRKFPHMFTAG
jgi:hypothetical protein